GHGREFWAFPPARDHLLYSARWYPAHSRGHSGMTLREQLAAFWAGERPDQIPYTIYQSKLPPVDHPVVQGMFANGLGVTCFVPTWEVTYHASIDMRDDVTLRDGVRYRRQTWRTPLG